MTFGDPDGFEGFPRGRLSLRWDRRRILSVLASEVRILADENRWGATRRLADLGSLPDDLLELLTPTVVPDGEIAESDGFVWGRLPPARKQTRLFRAGSPAASAFEGFDGHTQLAATARRLAEELGWESSRAFAYVRGLFLHLVTLGFCRPK